MNTSYIIQWKSKINGRAGRGTKQFDKQSAEQLVEELNLEYPQIHHEAIEVGTTTADVSAREPVEAIAA